MDEPNQALLESSFERVVVASTTLQILFMKARSICHWEDPTKSSAYMAIYFLLVFYNQLASGVVSARFLREEPLLTKSDLLCAHKHPLQAVESSQSLRNAC